MIKKFAFASLFVLFTSIANAGEAPYIAEDPVVEAEVMRISEELRCLVCQNQTIAESNAPLAVDLRREVREMVKKGMAQDEVVTFMETRYGDFVRYRPAFKSSTILLWFGPLILFVIGVGLLYYNLLRKRKNVDETTPLSEEEKARVAALFKQDNVGEDKA